MNKVSLHAGEVQILLSILAIYDTNYIFAKSEDGLNRKTFFNSDMASYLELYRSTVIEDFGSALVRMRGTLPRRIYSSMLFIMTSNM